MYLQFFKSALELSSFGLFSGCLERMSIHAFGGSFQCTSCLCTSPRGLLPSPAILHFFVAILCIGGLCSACRVCFTHVVCNFALFVFVFVFAFAFAFVFAFAFITFVFVTFVVHDGYDICYYYL